MPNSTPKWDYKGYEGKARRFLRWMKARDVFDGRSSRMLEWDGPWVQAGHAYNVGAKLVVWMVDHDMLVRRGDTLPRMSVGAILDDWYRIAGPGDITDLGDLWIE